MKNISLKMRTTVTSLRGDIMDKIIYALNLVVDFIEANDFIDERSISDYLFFTGFDDYEVRQVMAVLDIDGLPEQKYFRIFSKNEKNNFTPDAVNYLNKLLVSGVLDILSVEDIIERAQETPGFKTDLDTVKELTLFSFIERKSGINGDSSADEYIQ